MTHVDLRQRTVFRRESLPTHFIDCRTGAPMLGELLKKPLSCAISHKKVGARAKKAENTFLPLCNFEPISLFSEQQQPISCAQLSKALVKMATADSDLIPAKVMR